MTKLVINSMLAPCLASPTSCAQLIINGKFKGQLELGVGGLRGYMNGSLDFWIFLLNCKHHSLANQSEVRDPGQLWQRTR